MRTNSIVMRNVLLSRGSFGNLKATGAIMSGSNFKPGTIVSVNDILDFNACLIPGQESVQLITTNEVIGVVGTISGLDCLFTSDQKQELKVAV